MKKIKHLIAYSIDKLYYSHIQILRGKFGGKFENNYKNLPMFKSFDPAIPLLGTHPTDILVQNVRYVCIRSLFVALFLIRLEIFKYSSMGDWLNKL